MDRKAELASTGIDGLSAKTEVAGLVPSIHDLGKRISSFRERTHLPSARISRTGLAMLVAVSILAAAITPSINNPVQAEGNFFKVPIILQSVDNPYNFTYKGNVRRWPFDNARFGIPPNNSERGVGTIDDSFNNDTIPTFEIQPQESKYPETQLGYGISLAIGAVGADPESGCGGMETNTPRPDGNTWNAYYESIRSLDNPVDQSDGARVVTNAGFPVHGINGNSVQGFIIGKDAAGSFVRVLFTNTVDPTEAGWRRASRIANSCVIRGSFVNEGLRPYKSYLPGVFVNAN